VQAALIIHRFKFDNTKQFFIFAWPELKKWFAILSNKKKNSA